MLRQLNHRSKIVIGGLAIFLAILLLGYFLWPTTFGAIAYEKSVMVTSNNEKDLKEAVTHIATPEPLKAIYMTSCIASSKKARSKLVNLVKTTELNSLVIDVKDYSGNISFKPESDLLLPAWNGNCPVIDMKEFVKELHEQNIYAIGRITVFQDPFYAPLHPKEAVQTKAGNVWKDRKGISFLDPASKNAREYIVLLANETYDLGFDEINFDYIRYPSDGDMGDIVFPQTGTRLKADVLEDFFSYLAGEMKKKRIPISADLFGMTTTSRNDMNIGQVLERAVPHFDFIAPMVYPSHYPPNYQGYKDPNKFPYEIVNRAMLDAVSRLEATTTPIFSSEFSHIGTTTPAIYEKPVFNRLKLRPWLQDFNYGKTYTAEDVRKQIKATYDAGLTSWMLWSPSNVYTKEALDKDL